MHDNPFQSPASVEDLPPKTKWRVPWGKIALGVGLLVVVIALALPAVRRPRSHVYRLSCRSQLKQISVALDEYVKKHGAYPPAYTVDANGKPLHSWRTLLLPFLEEEALYKKIDLTKPWDDPVNAAAFKTVVGAYQCPVASFDSDMNMTTYLAIVSPQSILRGGKSATRQEITDGLDKTVVLIEVPENHAVLWMSPQDADEALFTDVMRETDPEQKLQWTHMGGIGHLLFTNGHIEDLVSTDKTATERRALITIAGGD